MLLNTDMKIMNMYLIKYILTPKFITHNINLDTVEK